jgi:hypothetical protein
MPLPKGPFGQPQYNNNEPANFGEDLTAVSDFAADAADRRRDTIAQANAITPKWDGMNVYVSETATVYTWQGGKFWPRWRPRTSYARTYDGGAPSFGSAGTVVSEYSISDGWVDMTYTAVVGGSAPSFSDTRLFPPVAPDSSLLPSTNGMVIVGQISMTDISEGANGRYAGRVGIVGTGSFRWMADMVNGSIGSQLRPLTSAYPFAWAIGDELQFTARYPIA